MKYIAGSVIPVFAIGWVLDGQDKFGYILGIGVATGLYLLIDWLTKTDTYRSSTPGTIRSLPLGLQSDGAFITEKEVEALGRLLTFADLVSEQGHRSDHGMVEVSVLTWDDFTVDYRNELARFSDDGVPIATALKNRHRG